METLTRTRIIGPLLSEALSKISQNVGSEQMLRIAAQYNAVADSMHDPLLPIVVKLDPEPPRKGEGWKAYKERISERLLPVSRMLKQVIGLDAEFLIAANGLQTAATPDQIRFLSGSEDFQVMELDPLQKVVAMDDAFRQVGMPAFHTRHSGIDGSGVRVAVLDSGIDLLHPFLRVTSSVSTCGQSIDIPGRHGTHCAGSIASRDTLIPGIAPGVELLNIKVLDSFGEGTPGNFQKGIDAALDLDAEVLSVSLGWNHLPKGTDHGHGWSCPPETCAVCTAVNTASAIEGVVVVAAAGNEHERADYLRRFGRGSSFDTELICPGHAREAITVGAHTKDTYIPAGFTSRGPTNYGLDKPDICAPGVEIISTGPVPRDASWVPLPNPRRTDLFFTDSGSSMATPIVSGVVALIIQMLKSRGVPVTPATVKNSLYTNGIQRLTGFGINDVGRGRIYAENL